MADIDAKWEEIRALINYEPDVRWVLQNVSVEQKKLLLCKHSEKIALCFGMLEYPPGHKITIVKNLRMCGDCHTATALISKLTQYEIEVRDAKVFHIFKDGKCICNGKY